MSKSIVNLFLIITITALYIFVINPLQKGGGTIVGLDKSINELAFQNNDLANNQEKVKNLTDMASKYQSDYELLKKVELGKTESVEQSLMVMIPKVIDPVRVEEEVARILVNRGFSIDSISYSQNQQTLNTKYGSYDITFSTKGDYKRFKQLINDFETSKRVYVVKSVSFSSPSILDSKAASDSMPFQVKLETYYMN